MRLDCCWAAKDGGSEGADRLGLAGLLWDTCDGKRPGPGKKTMVVIIYLVSFP